MTRRIEPISRAAADPVSMLHRACFPQDPWDVVAIERMMAMPGFFGCAGWARDAAVGFALALDLGTECEILSLGVLPARRRAGFGSALLDSICVEARSRGVGDAVLEVAADNDPARALYASRGFTIVGRRRNYYRQTGGLVDALILRASLATASPAT
jgi:[ribosomal protein S18]-alanine N-acetyltransferase